MKHFVMFAALCCSLFLPACDLGGDGTRSSCVTAMLGSFDGDRVGRMVGLMGYDGTFFVTFYIDESDMKFDSTISVGEDGMLTPGDGVLDLTGTLDFDTCVGSGDWSIGSNNTGTWSASPREDAL